MFEKSWNRISEMQPSIPDWCASENLEMSEPQLSIWKRVFNCGVRIFEGADTIR